MSVYALPANGKVARKMNQDPEKNPDRHQKILAFMHHPFQNIKL